MSHAGTIYVTTRTSLRKIATNLSCQNYNAKVEDTIAFLLRFSWGCLACPKNNVYPCSEVSNYYCLRKDQSREHCHLKWRCDGYGKTRKEAISGNVPRTPNERTPSHWDIQRQTQYVQSSNRIIQECSIGRKGRFKKRQSFEIKFRAAYEEVLLFPISE